jgi:hypothetical protein
MSVPSLSWQNDRFYTETAQRRRRFSHLLKDGDHTLVQDPIELLQKTHTTSHQRFFHFELSRACVGELIVVFTLSIKWRKNGRFAHELDVAVLVLLHERRDSGEETLFFWSFPYVCPEPVLVKSSF